MCSRAKLNWTVGVPVSLKCSNQIRCSVGSKKARLAFRSKRSEGLAQSGIIGHAQACTI